MSFRAIIFEHIGRRHGFAILSNEAWRYGARWITRDGRRMISLSIGPFSLKLFRRRA